MTGVINATKHFVPTRGRPWPQLDPATVERLMTRLGEPWDRASFERAVTVYKKLRRRNLLNTVGILTVASLVIVANLVLLVLITISSWETPSKIGGVVALLVLIAVVMFTSDAVLRFPADNATATFLLRAGAFCRVLGAEPKGQELDLALALSRLGGMARSLFAYLQRSRLTWTAPPEVANRALRITYPLVNIDTTCGFGERGTNQGSDLASLRRFVLDAASLVVIGRAHLIPRCRASMYPEIPGHDHDERVIDDRVALHLDPMRHRTRWEVIKDFVLPLAAWIGVVVSLAVSLSKSG